MKIHVHERTGLSSTILTEFSFAQTIEESSVPAYKYTVRYNPVQRNAFEFQLAS